uniref:Uncharacterized protein n=1 Tax=Anguilla anguilla TaxID=7936 RepID=A0A0E9TTS8_ANGAN
MKELGTGCISESSGAVSPGSFFCLLHRSGF